MTDVPPTIPDDESLEKRPLPLPIEEDDDEGLGPLPPEQAIQILGDVIKTLPPEQQELGLVALQHISMSIEHTGPIPDPSTMGRYEDITPGLADRIMRMAEKEQDHRQNSQTFILTSRDAIMRENKSIERHGLNLAFALALTALVLGAILSGMGRDLTGFGLLLTAVGGLATVFLYTRRRAQKDSGADKKPEEGSG